MSLGPSPSAGAAALELGWGWALLPWVPWEGCVPSGPLRPHQPPGRVFTLQRYNLGLVKMPTTD